MKKLELKHLCGYLPHKLKMVTGDGVATLVGIPDIMINKNVVALHFGTNLKRKKFDFGYGNSEFNKPSNFGYYYINTVVLQNIFDKAYIVDYSSSRAIPLLLPLSALTETLPDGSIPIVELARLCEMIEPISFNKMDNLYNITRGICAQDKLNNQWLMYSFSGSFSMWHKPHGTYDHIPTVIDNQLQLFDYLYSIHADIYDLIGHGLAIDKRTIK